MDDKKFDELLTNSLKQKTDPSARMKEQVWENIERKMLEHDIQEYQETKGRGVTRMTAYKKKGRAKRFIAVTTAAGILLVALFTVSTESGQAFISQIRQMFEPEKKVVEEIEGMPEETDMNLHENETTAEREADYVIYVDEERYSVSKENGVHRIEAKIDGDYPDVYMEITQDKDRKPAEIAEDLKEQLAAEYPTVSEVTEVDDPVTGYHIRALAGQEWNSEVIVYYVVSNEIEGSFIIKQAYFFEASEGHGVRMNDMLREFQIVVTEEENK